MVLVQTALLQQQSCCVSFVLVSRGTEMIISRDAFHSGVCAFQKREKLQNSKPRLKGEGKNVVWRREQWKFPLVLGFT